MPGIIVPQMYAGALANVANLLTNYVFIHALDLGVNGSAAANTLSKIYICAFLFACIWWKKLHKATWRGWSLDSLQEWGPFMKLALPSTLMTCFEWWLYDFGGFFAGILGKDQLAVHHALITVGNLNYMMTLSIQGAACARVGNALGAGHTAGALFTCKVALSLSVVFTIVQAAVLGSTKSVIGFLFTSDAKIVRLLSGLLSVYSFLQIFDGIVGVSAGIFFGTGKQKIAAVANLVGYYGVGLSVGVVLMFVAKLNILGFWLGLLLCVVLQSTFYVAVIFRLNWKRITEEALKRAQTTTIAALLNTSTATDHRAGLGRNSAEGSTHVSGETPPADPDDVGQLSVSQLVLRRGVTAVTLLGLLVAGVCLHFLVPPTENLSPLRVNLTDANVTSAAASDY